MCIAVYSVVEENAIVRVIKQAGPPAWLAQTRKIENPIHPQDMKGLESLKKKKKKDIQIKEFNGM